MIDKISIRNKYDEFSALYTNRHIDDFDTFICARVADYFINQCCASTDTIYAEIEKALCEPISEDNDDDDGNEISHEDDQNGDIITAHHSQTNPKTGSVFSKITKAMPYIVGAGAAFVGVIAWVAKRKKR